MNSEKFHCIKCMEFFGSPERDGMCSVCFRKPSIDIKKEEIKDNNDNSKNVILIEKVEENKIPEQINKMNCWKCQIRVGYLGFNCNCGYVFCGKHRHFSDHNCDFDYKNYDKQKLKNKIENFHNIK